MNHLYLVILKFIPVLLLILLGNSIRRWNMIKPDTIQELKKIIINLSLPSLLFMTFAQTDFKGNYIFIFVAIFIICLLMLILGTWLKKALKVDNKYFPAMFSGFETGMLGYALFTAVYGAANTYKLAIFDIGQVTFVFFVLVSYLQKQNGDNTNARQLFSNFFKSPVIISILLGIVFGSTGLTGIVEKFQITGSITDTLNLLGNLTEPLICIIIGYELQIKLNNILKPFLTVAFRMSILLFLAFLLNTFLIEKVLHLDKSFEIALYTLFLLPPPFVIPIYIDQKAENNKQYILSVISIHIIMTMAGFIVLASIL